MRSVIAGGAHPYEEDLSALREFALGEIMDGWEASDAPLSLDSKRRLLAMDQAVLIASAPDRVDHSDRLGNLQVPCLMVSGTDDWRFEDMRRFAEGNDRCEFVAHQDLDHLQTWLRPEVLLPPVLDFLRSSR